MALAKAMHCHAVEPDSLQGLGQAILDAFKSDRPTIILVHEESDWLA